MSEDKPRRPPSFIAYNAREGKDGQSYFSRVGAAFPHKDGKGHQIVLESIPVDGRIALRSPQERLEALRQGKGERKDREIER